MSQQQPAADYVDRLTEVMTGLHTDAQLQAKALAYRLRRVAHRLETEMRRELAPHGIELWELELLACLRRAPGHRLTAGELTGHLQLTSGAVTNRVGRLEAKGWLTRTLHPGDRRSVLVALTAEGRERAERVFATKTDTETRLLSTLPPDRQRALNDELRALLLELEGPDGDASDHG
ncbi:MarR family transcriptional regulator [Streptantibioticus parmotrematis]|uniref:MarR family winged helix-turn-helix transcriptional regulator n=1 Tax=Streptantibioticus parmotrematis TaxID=2873249 RepID=UPI0033CDE365